MARVPTPLSLTAAGSTMPTTNSRDILSLQSWRTKATPSATASLTSFPVTSKAAPSSYAKVVSSAAGALLPRRDSEAQRVKEEVSKYRRDNGLSEESYFTPMVKLTAEQTGVLRPKPIANNSVPVSESTAVYLKGLPGDTTYYDLLMNIHCGQIWHTYIDPPNPPKQLTAAAKVSFLTRIQAEAFMNDIECGRYFVRGQRVINCIWDRRCEMVRPDVMDSRCIQIKGPNNMMEWAWFEREFTTKMDLKITDFFDVECNEPGSRIFQINFSGIYAQSRAVIKALEKDFSDIYHFRYVPDPCNDNAY